MAIYNPKSLKAEEFINHEEIEETLRYAEENKHNIPLIDSILEKARPKKSGKGSVCTGLTHREASVLLACDIPEKIEEIFRIAEEIKLAYYGNRIVLFAPLYLSNYCVNGCVYCPYHLKNKHIPRRKLTQEEVAKEVIALQDMGHKRLAIEAGEDPVNNPIEYILDCIKTIYSIKHKNGAIRRVNVNIAATTVENYRKLREPVNPTEHRTYLGADNPDEWPTYFLAVNAKSQSESDNNRWFFGDYGSDSSAHNAYATTDGSTKIQAAAEAKHSFEASFMKGTQTIVLDGAQVWSLSNDADFDTGKNLHIFSSGSRYRSAARCYGLEIWQDGNKVRDFKPCVYDGKAMLYDTISKTLYRPSPDIPESKAGPVVFTGEEKPICYVDYVESDGTIFVDTGVTGKSGTKADLKLQFKEKADKGFLDSRTGDSRFYLIHNGANNNIFYIGYGKAQSFSPCAINTDYTVQSELSVGRQEVTVDGVSKWTTGQTTTYINPSDNINTGYNLYLFAMNQDGSPTYAGQARLYYLKLYQGDSDGSNMKLVRNLKPVRLSNDVVVLWDFVEKKAYRPQLVSSPGTYTTFTSVGADGEAIRHGLMIVVR